jgi:uncharacterized protein involved in exopolysaccharide biosynthesis
VNPSSTPSSNAGEIAVSIPADLAQLFWSRRRGVAFITFVAGIVGLVSSLLWPPNYHAVATFIPEQTSSSRLATGLGGLAGQLGVPLGSDPVQSPRFYAEVLLSRRVIERVLRGYFSSTETGLASPDSASLLDLLQVRGRDSLERVQKGVKMLRAAVTVDADIRTNIVTLVVTARNPDLAAAIANRFLQAVNEFNTLSRQSQGGRRRRFIEEQADSAARELRTAEDRLKSFYEENRLWTQSAALQYRLGQLQREVEIEKEVYLTLRRNLITAAIDEVNDVPLISVIDEAVPLTDRKPRRALIVLAGLLLGGIIGLSYAYIAWYLDRPSRWEQSVQQR